MRRRILVAMLSVTMLAVLGFGVPLALVVERFVEEDATARVERAAVLATRQVSSTFAVDNDPVELPQSADGITYGLYDRAGTLVAGVGPEPADEVTRMALTNAVIDGEVDGQLVVAVPVTADERVVAVVRASRPTSTSDTRTTRVVLLLGLLAGAVIAGSGALGWILAGRLSGPVGRLRDGARQLGDGDFAVAVGPSTIPEIDQAAAALNATARRLGDLIARERAFSADASHQLRTPITGMRSAIETEIAFPRDDRRAVLDELLSDVDRLERTVTDLLAIARVGDISTEVDMSAVLVDLEATWERRLRQHGRSLRVSPVRYRPAALANAAMLRHALDVLVDNALRHGGGVVSVAVASNADAITITVSDQGPGFAPVPGLPAGADDTSTAETTTISHGLGLPLAQRLVEAMGGRLVIAGEGPDPHVDIVLRRAEAPGV